MKNQREKDDLAFKLARLAHWSIDDRGYTKKMVATELARIACELSPDLARQSLGRAAALIGVVAPPAGVPRSEGHER